MGSSVGFAKMTFGTKQRGSRNQLMTTVKDCAAMNRTALVVFLSAIIGCGQAPIRSPVAGSLDKTASLDAGGEVSLQVLDYDQIQKLIESKRGRVVVMDAWSTSCPPCIKEFPNLVALHKKYGPDRVACISLSFDYEGIGQPEDVADKVRKFLVEQQATFDNILSKEESDALYRKFKLISVPAVFVYDHHGKLVKRFHNEDAKGEADAFTYEQVGALVEELLK